LTANFPTTLDFIWCLLLLLLLFMILPQLLLLLLLGCLIPCLTANSLTILALLFWCLLPLLLLQAGCTIARECSCAARSSTVCSSRHRGSGAGCCCLCCCLVHHLQQVTACHINQHRQLQLTTPRHHHSHLQDTNTPVNEQRQALQLYYQAYSL
jgi:hypothetical protein